MDQTVFHIVFLENTSIARISNQVSPASTEGSKVLLSQVTSGWLRANSELLFSVLQIHHGEKMVTTLNRQMRK